MFSEQLKKILNLIKKTGDKVIVFNADEPDNSYVLMDFSSYETIAEPKYNHVDKFVKIANEEESTPIKRDIIVEQKGLTEEDLTDKINHEISVWKNGQNAESLAADDRLKKAWSIPSQVKDKAQEIE